MLIVLFRCWLADTADYNKIDIVIIVPLVFILIKLFNKNNNIKKLMCFFGKKSTYMWLLHMFLIYGFSGCISWGKYSIVVYLLLLVEAYLLSYFLEKIESVIKAIVCRITIFTYLHSRINRVWGIFINRK